MSTIPQSTTPRTDAAVRLTIGAGFNMVYPSFARELETELAAARVEVERLRKRSELLTDHYECKMNIPERVSNIETEHAAMKARAEKAEAEVERLALRLDWLEREALEDWGIRSIDRASIDHAMKESIEVPDPVSIEARDPTGGVE